MQILPLLIWAECIHFIKQPTYIHFYGTSALGHHVRTTLVDLPNVLLYESGGLAAGEKDPLHKVKFGRGANSGTEHGIP